MPKIIENARERLIAEAKKQLLEKGYSALTVRSVAAACGIGTGTFYNYFDSKNKLIAVVMLEDWQACLNAINSGEQSGEPEKLLFCIFSELRKFVKNHEALFADPQAKKIFAGELSRYHELLRDQLAEPVFRLCTKEKYENAQFLAEFIAEALITWTIAGKDYNELSGILLKLF